MEAPLGKPGRLPAENTLECRRERITTGAHLEFQAASGRQRRPSRAASATNSIATEPRSQRRPPAGRRCRQEPRRSCSRPQKAQARTDLLPASVKRMGLLRDRCRAGLLKGLSSCRAP